MGNNVSIDEQTKVIELSKDFNSPAEEIINMPAGAPEIEEIKEIEEIEEIEEIIDSYDEEEEEELDIRIPEEIVSDNESYEDDFEEEEKLVIDKSEIKIHEININTIFKNKPATRNNIYWLYSCNNNSNDDIKTWAFMTNEYNEYLEKFYLNKYTINTTEYVYDFKNMTQTNIKTNKQRLIVRITDEELQIIKNKLLEYFYTIKNGYGCLIKSKYYLYPPFIQELLRSNNTVEYFNLIINLNDMSQINRTTLKKRQVGLIDTNEESDNIEYSFNY